MGPFWHNAPEARIDEVNLAGIDEFEFVACAHPSSGVPGDLYARMGHVEVARHRIKDNSVFRQGGINRLVNREPGTHAVQFIRDHGPCAPAMLGALSAPQMH